MIQTMDNTTDAIVSNELLLKTLRQRLVELDLKKPEISAYYDELKSVKKQIAEVQGLDTYFQAETGEVYKIFKPTQKIVFFDEVEYKRTPRDGEAPPGRLSKKEAKEQGFEVK